MEGREGPEGPGRRVMRELSYLVGLFPWPLSAMLTRNAPQSTQTVFASNTDKELN